MVYDIDECGNMILENLTVKCDKLYLSLIRLIFPHISFTSATNIEILRMTIVLLSILFCYNSFFRECAMIVKVKYGI